jgi:hypothetical protein
MGKTTAPRFLGIDRSRGLDQQFATAVIDINGLINPRETIEVAVEGIRERAAQDIRWGESSHPDVPAGVKFPCAFFGIPTADAARLHCETAFRTGSGSNAHILLEEVCEAIEEAHNPERLRAELVQVMAVAMKWIEQIDRRQGFGGAAGNVIAVDELAVEGNAHG